MSYKCVKFQKFTSNGSLFSNKNYVALNNFKRDNSIFLLVDGTLCVISDILVICNDCYCLNNSYVDCTVISSTAFLNHSIFLVGKILPYKERALIDDFTGYNLLRFVKEVVDSSVSSAALFRPRDIRCKCVCIT